MDALRRRLTYLMLFRVGLVTLLLGATAAAELAAPFEPAGPGLSWMFVLIIVIYGLTIAYAIVLRRTRALGRMAAAQVAIDLLCTTMVVHLTGGSESVFVFAYLLAIVGASSVLPRRGAFFATAAALVLFVGQVIARRIGLLTVAGPFVLLSSREIVRSLAINVVAFVATGALAARLAIELKSADERLATQGTRLRDLATLHQDMIRSLTSGLITVGEDGRVVTFNIAAAEILGIDAQQAVGSNVAEVLPTLVPRLSALAPNEAVRRGTLAHRGADGVERTFGVSLMPLVDANGRPVGRIVNFQDLTELKRMEEAVVQSERLAAVGRLAAGIAHEIRNPLAAISGSIELLSQSAGGDRESKELMGIVLREVERLNALISELLEFARPRRPEPQRLEVGAELTEMLRVFENDKRLEGARVELRADGAVWIDADPSQLRQVVWNLLRNAAEASPAGAPIDVEVAGEAGWARLTVRDRGAGIAPEHRARMFEPFFSTKEKGTGLGLATVHRIVEDHRGRIEIETAKGGGTAMTVRLPLGTPA